VVRWIFAQRLAGHSVARIARALNEAEVPCSSASGPGRNRHRSGTGWTLGTVTTILQNPRYTGHQVWNRQRTDKDLVDPADVSLGHKQVQRWNLPGARRNGGQAGMRARSAVICAPMLQDPMAAVVTQNGMIWKRSGPGDDQ
jgi:Recombinase